jgi:urease gamma subunit
VHLTPREHERLLLAAAAGLARRRLARGAPLGATEAVALVCDEVCELAWDGVPLPEVIDRARAVIPPAALLPGVAALVPVIEVEALFPWGSTLVHVDAPFAEHQEPGGEVPGQGQGQEQGEAERGRPDPGTARSPAGGPGVPGGRGGLDGPGEPGGPSEAGLGGPGGPAVATAPPGVAGPGVPGVRYGPGAVLPRAGVIELAAGAVRRAALLRNAGPRDVWISSHFPLGEVNPAVQLRWADQEDGSPVLDEAPRTGAGSAAGAAAPGTGARDSAGAPGHGTGTGAGSAGAGARPAWRLDLAAGEALLLRAGEEREVTVVARPG